MCAFFFNPAENLVADASSNIHMIAKHAKGEICYYKYNNTLLFWGFPLACTLLHAGSMDNWYILNQLCFVTHKYTEIITTSTLQEAGLKQYTLVHILRISAVFNGREIFTLFSGAVGLQIHVHCCIQYVKY